MRYLRFIIAIVICTQTSVYAQDAEQILEKISSTYLSTKEFTLEMEYRLYPSYTSQKLVESQEVIIKHKNGVAYTKMFNTETLVNDDYVVILNHDSKILMIEENKNSFKEKLETKAVINLDSLLAFFEPAIEQAGYISSEFQSKNLDENTSMIQVSFSDGEYESIRVYYHPKDYLLQKAIYFYRDEWEIKEGAAEKPRLEMHYLSYQTKLIGSLAISQFLKLKPNGDLIPKTDYQDYLVINHVKNKWDSDDIQSPFSNSTR